MTMDFDRSRTEIVTQTQLLTGQLAGADLGAPVPSCPGWTVARLVGHLAGAQRWAADIVATRATAPLPDDDVRDVGRYDGIGEGALSGRVDAAAARLAAVLDAAGPDARMWCPVPGGGTPFYARRFAHETAVHRADAALALGLPFRLDPAVAVDGVEEWLELGCLPFHFDIHPRMRELLGPDRTIGLHATDTGDDWLLDFTGDVIEYRRGTGPAAAEVHAAVTDLLLVLYRRVGVGAARVTGDTAFVDFWLDRVGFG